MNSVPAIPYLTIVKQFALAKGMSFFTWKDMTNACKDYMKAAKKLN